MPDVRVDAVASGDGADAHGDRRSDRGGEGPVQVISTATRAICGGSANTGASPFEAPFRGLERENTSGIRACRVRPQ